MKKLIIFNIIYIIIMLVGCSVNNLESKTKNDNKEDIFVEPLVISNNNGVDDNDEELEKTFQEKYSMDWDFIDEEYLLKIAQYKSGTVEDRAYTILVTLNRVWTYSSDESYESYSEHTTSMIQDVVLRELYEVEKISSSDFEKITPDEATKEALCLVKYKSFDNSNGSLEYK